MNDLGRMNIPFRWAIEHLFNIALEFGAFIRVKKTEEITRPQIPEIFVSYSRSEKPSRID